MTSTELIARLRSAGLATGSEVRLTPLGGGVSSDIHLVETKGGCFVVKRALPKLRVRDEWFADVSRNRVERDWFEYARGVAPESVPRILAADPEAGWFAMEYVGGGAVTWKARLLAGDARPEDARRAGVLLGRLHRSSWADQAMRGRFSTLPNFHALRIAPYLLTTAERVPAVAAELRDEARRLEHSDQALVHGDYSPKNLLVSGDRVTVLDAEVAWFGDPAFDVAFLLTHLHLKALLHASRPDPILALIPTFWSAYQDALGTGRDERLEERTARLLLCLLLARVHGKSPVEYLTAPSQREVVTEFCCRHLPRPPRELAAMTSAWRQFIISP